MTDVVISSLPGETRDSVEEALLINSPIQLAATLQIHLKTKDRGL
jgi:tRNA U34 5-carboxymethylaminomethyl modifying GTPase MnmE/TrmE